LFGFVAAVLTLSSHPTHAAPYADIVVDANSGAVLQATNPDARRHPASLTKIMTLYLLFEQLEAGKLKLDSPLKVSAEAAGQTPTKLGLKPGGTLAVEDAIKGMVTRSANDAAVVVAEAIAGNEGDFAKLMTRKAQALGMTNTVYKNASGLPDDNQVTTARDQSTLGRAIQERFPRYYKYFSIRSFTFRGEAIANHNRLLGKVEGVDGIKTGYINASGFNLVTSVHRGNRYLVAVVMGGSSGGSRDARMRELISDKIAQASTKRTAPMIAEASGTSDVKPEPMVVTKAKAEAKPEPVVAAKAEPKPEPMVVTKPEPKVAAAKVEPQAEAKPEAKAEAKAEPRFAVASATSLPVRFNPAAPPAEPAAMRSEPAAATAPTQARAVVGSTEPIRPVLVKTLTVKAGVRTASLAALHVASPAAEPQPVAAAAPAPTPVAAAKPEPVAPPPAPVTAAKPEPSAPPSAPVAAAKPEPAAPPSAPAAATKPEPAAAAPEVAAKPEPAAAPPTPAIAVKAEPAAPPPISVAAAKLEPPAEPPGPGVSSASPAPVAAAAPTPAAPAAKAAPTKPPAKPASAAPAKPQHKPGWMIQVGAYPAEQAAKQRLSAVQSKASKMLTGAEAFTETIDKGGTTYYRARFAGLDKDKAEAACKYLKKNDVECVTIKN
jgi:D-alanyl-D-alanine carboxypeptidase